MVTLKSGPSQNPWLITGGVFSKAKRANGKAIRKGVFAWTTRDDDEDFQHRLKSININRLGFISEKGLTNL